MTLPAAAAFALLCAVSSAEERDLTILHFNDLHAAMEPDSGRRGGVTALAGVIRRETANCTSCIVLTAGDLVQGSPSSTIFRGKPIYEIVNLIRPDASTLGNHEFDYGWKQTKSFSKKAKFPIVDANIVHANGKLLARKPYAILKRNGLRIGVIGAMTETLDTLTLAKFRGPWRTTPLVDSIRKTAAELKLQTDIIILLAHVTADEEDAILRDAPEIPVSVSGHVHTGLQQPKSYQGRTLVRVQASGRELGRLRLKVDPERKSATFVEWNRIPVNAAEAQPAPDVARKVAEWEKKAAKVVNVPIGEAKHAIAGNELKRLIEQAAMDEMHVDFAFMNRGGIRGALPQGRLLAAHVWKVYPFDNYIVVGRFQGRRLPPAVTQGRTVDPDRYYTVAVSDFTAENQRSPTELNASGLEFTTRGPMYRDLLIEWIKKKRVLP